MAGSYTLDEQSEAFVESLVESGRYESVGDVLRDSLRLMQAREAKLEELRAAIQEGLASGPMEEVGSMFERIKAEGRKRLAAERGE
ncbi:type II toxin-antitoxin system ParD family antitoxin [Rhodopseudomonas palustris]|uniref:type II toxin-antitoxin system ParD family antitoxin n=1 Tax=Rhodopseudomonas palustris TaxID=1076 RepID=UPI002ACE0FEC|nr:type II toxin-antitoxin system ParD family antitoxin [Rhodopseudomonas palustris]WQG98780.1 type II toxin-antitoxin system ParD family antitoxin [Rhodopseudomonas palustris]